MAPASPQDITELLLAWSEGKQDALQRLTPLVYGVFTAWHTTIWRESGLATRCNQQLW